LAAWRSADATSTAPREVVGHDEHGADASLSGMPANGPCPSCGGQLVQLDRSGVRIDACRQCRGVWLDRGELDQILERERNFVAHAHDDDDEEFFREMSGGGSHSSQQRYGFDAQTAKRMYSDYKAHKSHSYHHKKKKKSFLDELFD
jgi:Zn-finger nucleic acid-binding protein